MVIIRAIPIRMTWQAGLKFFVLAIPIGSVANQPTANHPKRQCDNRQKEVENEREGRKATSQKKQVNSKGLLALFNSETLTNK